MIKIASSPSKLRSKLKLSVYLTTLCLENGEFSKKGAVPSIYKYYFHDFLLRQSLSARDFDALCTLESFCVDISELKDRRIYSGKSVGLSLARSLETKLIPLCLVIPNGDPDVYFLSPKAKEGIYVAELVASE